MAENDKPILVAIVVTGFQHEHCIIDGYLAQSANIEFVSGDISACFELTTGPLSRDKMQGFELIQRHGFTVIELPCEWRHGYRDSNSWHGPIYSDKWKGKLIECALQRITKLYEGKERPKQVTVYNPEFARSVLEEINKHFPSPVLTLNLKYSFEDEPSDDELLITLAGLQKDELIRASTLFAYTSANRELHARENIEITAKGREELAGARLVPAHTIVQGDQYNNYGTAAAIGQRSAGTINHQQQWGAIQNQVDLNALAGELEQLKKHLTESASSSSDFQQLGLLADAEQYAKNKDGRKVMEVLSKVGKSVLSVARNIGTEIVSKVIAKSMGLES